MSNENATKDANSSTSQPPLAVPLPIPDHIPKTPFPHRLVTVKKWYYSEIMEVFKQVKINLPFLDDI